MLGAPPPLLESKVKKTATYTCAEVAAVMGTSRENIRQIEQNALRKLRQALALREFWEAEPSPVLAEGCRRVGAR